MFFEEKVEHHKIRYNYLAFILIKPKIYNLQNLMSEK